VVPYSRCPGFARGATHQSHSYHPSWDKQVSPDKATPSIHCVKLSRVIAVAPTGLSPYSADTDAVDYTMLPTRMRLLLLLRRLQ
jgi:hypothetical protein